LMVLVRKNIAATMAPPWEEIKIDIFELGTTTETEKQNR